MSNIIVLYGSIYGTTKQYAEWIAEALQADICAAESFSAERFSQYDKVVFGGGLYAGSLHGLDVITKNAAQICDKEIVLFSVGSANVDIKKNTDSIRESLLKKLPSEIADKVRIFHLRGGIDYKRLSFKHMTMMRMLKMMILCQKNRDVEQEQLLREFGKTSYFVDRNTIAPLVESLGATFAK